MLTTPRINFVLLACLGSTIVLGCCCLLNYAFEPSQSAQAELNLAEVELISDSLVQSSIIRNSGKCNAILFYHPHCPCTNATIENLKKLNTEFFESAHLTAFGFCPANAEDTWCDSSMTSEIRKLGGKVIADPAGAWCVRFGVSTSGHILVYNADDELVFSGGITTSRGHEGECNATKALVESVDGKIESSRYWPVFGCPIVVHEEVRP